MKKGKKIFGRGANSADAVAVETDLSESTEYTSVGSASERSPRRWASRNIRR